MEEEDSFTYLTFDLGGQTLGVDVRGSSVPIVDLCRRLGVAPGDWAEEARMVVLEFATAKGHRQIGIQADRVRSVDQIAPSEIEPIPRDGLGHWDADVLLGLSHRHEDLLALIDLQGMFGDAGEELDLTAGMGFF